MHGVQVVKMDSPPLATTPVAVRGPLLYEYSQEYEEQDLSPSGVTSPVRPRSRYNEGNATQQADENAGASLWLCLDFERPPALQIHPAHPCPTHGG